MSSARCQRGSRDADRRCSWTCRRTACTSPKTSKAATRPSPGKAIAGGVVNTALVHIEDTVAGGGTEADTVEHRSLLEQAIGQGMTALGLPVRVVRLAGDARPRGSHNGGAKARGRDHRLPARMERCGRGLVTWAALPRDIKNSMHSVTPYSWNNSR
jgi:hypothetical protein